MRSWGSEGTGDDQFGHLTNVAVDGAGNVYAVDNGNDRVQKFSSDGRFLLKWGSEGIGDGQFDWTLGIAVDGAGNVYVADYTNGRVQMFSSEGQFLLNWGSGGGGDGQFNAPWGIALDGAGNVYVADTENDRVQVFGPVTPPPAPPTSIVIHDISGRWDSPSGTFLEFRRASPLLPAYDYQEFDSGGSAHGEGKALIRVRTLHLDGQNEFVGAYSGGLKIADAEISGSFRDSSGNTIPVTFTAADPENQTPVFLEGLPPVLPSATDISGRWDSKYGGGFVVLTRDSPFAVAYSFQGFDLGGSARDQGTVSLEEGELRITGHNGFVGDYSGVLHVRGDMLTGTVRDDSGVEAQFVLDKAP